MSEELFSTPEQDSPRLAWKKLHRVTVHQLPSFEPGLEDDLGNEVLEFVAFTGPFPNLGNSAQGSTEDEALDALASKRGWKLWNQ